MKSTIQRLLFTLAVATLGAGTVGTAAAQTATAAPSASPTPQLHRGHFRHFGGSRFVGSLLRATQQLNLTPEQRTNIKTILTNARPAHQPGAQPQQPGLTVLGNPADPGFGGGRAGRPDGCGQPHPEGVTLAGQIYAVLTPVQQQQLPTVLASIQAKEQARRAAWAAKHASG